MLYQNQPKRHHNGFTLIEVIVVMLIISIVISVAVVLFSRFNEKHNLLSNAQKIASLLNFCHRYSMFNQTTVHFILTKNGYALQKEGSTGTYSPWSPFPDSRAQFSLIQFHWISIKNNANTLTVSFHPDGSISAPLPNTPFNINLIFNSSPTPFAIKISSQGTITVTKRGKSIER